MKNKIKYRIKGHEKFAVREGWLNKGISAVNKADDALMKKDAPDTLGVGNNMVRSIRYWLRAFNLIDDIPRKGAYINRLAEVIKQNDKYFEDIFTLWILHSNLVKNSEEATSWYLFFNNCEIENYTKENIDGLMKSEILKYISKEISENSIKDDVTVLLNTYYKDKESNYDPEDKNICPFTELGLLDKTNDKYSKKQPDLSKLSEWVILYELACVFNNEDEGVDNVSIESLHIGENSIGKIYNISSIALNNYLDKLSNMSYIKTDRTAGIDMVYSQFKDTPIEIIQKYYSDISRVKTCQI